MPYSQILIVVFVIIGCYAQRPSRLEHKVNILERRLDFESHEIASIYQRLDEIDETVNKSLENYEKHCSIESNIQNADTMDVIILKTQDATNKVVNDLVRLRRAFGMEKLIFAELRNTFPTLRKQVERIQGLTADLQNENRYLNTISRDLKSKTGNHSSEIQELGRVINDVQDAIGFLTDNVDIIERKSNKCDTEITQQETEIQQLKIKVIDCQVDNEMLSDRMKEIESENADRIKKIESENANLTKIINILKKDNVQTQIKVDKIAEDIKRVTNDIDTTVGTFSSCFDAINKNYTRSGIYSLRLETTKTNLKVYCDQVTDGGGWIVFQRRMDGSEDFYRGWEEYKEGFGNLQAEFWLGNEYLSVITATGQHELRIDMEDFDGTRAFAQYKSFKVDDESQNYKLEVSDYHGNASDSLTRFHSGKGFTTKDRDNDVSDKFNCAEYYTGAWWYDNCLDSNLNGKYYKLGRCPAGKGIIWHYLKKSSIDSLKFVEMKLR